MPEPAFLIGIIFLAIVGYGLALLVLWRQPRAIKWFAVALVTVGLGYLGTTKTPVAVAKIIFGKPL